MLHSTFAWLLRVGVLCFVLGNSGSLREWCLSKMRKAGFIGSLLRVWVESGNQIKKNNRHYVLLVLESK
jgi:hypothetical protein